MPGAGDWRVRVPTVREWRRRRDQAGVLLGYVFKTPKGSRLRREAWRVYEDWREERITYTEALRRLKRLARKAGARERASTRPRVPHGLGGVDRHGRRGGRKQ